MKNKMTFLAGLICSIIGIVTFLMNVTISSWSFYRFGKINTGGILIVLLILAIIYLVAKRNKTGIILIASVLGLILLSLIMGIHMHINYMSAFNMILIVGLIAVGIGLIIKSFLQ